MQRLSLVFIGCAGSGKGTISKWLERDYALKAVSTGDLLRRESSTNTQLASTMQRGELVSDSVVTKLCFNEIRRLRHANGPGLTLDGFPRTLAQALSLDEFLLNSSGSRIHAIHMDVHPEILKDRITERWVHIPSGRLYHSTFNPPVTPSHDDLTGEPLTQRQDDMLHIWKNRMRHYEETSKPILQHYRNLDALTTLSGDSSSILYEQLQSSLFSHRYVKESSIIDTKQETTKTQLYSI